MWPYYSIKNITISDYEAEAGKDVPNKSFRYFYWKYFGFLCLPMYSEGYEHFGTYAEKPDPPHNHLMHDPYHEDMLETFVYHTAYRILRSSGMLAWLQGIAASMRQCPPEQMAVDQRAIVNAPAYQFAVQNTCWVYHNQVKPNCGSDLLQEVEEYFSDWTEYVYRYNPLMYMAGYVLASDLTTRQPLSADVQHRLSQMCTPSICNGANFPKELLNPVRYDDTIFWFEQAYISKPYPDIDETTLDDLCFAISDDILRSSRNLAWLQGIMAYVTQTQAQNLQVDEAAIRQSGVYQSNMQIARLMYGHRQSRYTPQELAELHQYFSDFPDYIHRNNLIMYVVGYLTALSIVDPDADISEDVENRLADMYAQSGHCSP